MSAELNVQVKLNMLEGEVKNLSERIKKSVGGVLGKDAKDYKPSPAGGGTTPSTRQPTKKEPISLATAASGMLRSLFLYRAISEALSQLRNAVMAVVNAFEKAKKLYVGGALSGFGTKGQTNRTAIAGILGVSEGDLMRFGEAYKYFSKEIKQSVDVISKNARPLAETNMQWGVLKIKMESLASTIAVNFKPAMDALIDGLGELIDFIQRHATSVMKNAKTAWSFTPGALIAGGVAGISRGLGSMFGGGSFGQGFFNQDMFGKKASSTPFLGAQMKQLGASAWEKMGLVIGGTGGTNYAKDTAHNTKRTNNLLEKLANSIKSQQEGHSVFQAQPALP